MVSADAARTVFGVIGNVISFVMFLCPVPTMAKIWERRAVEEFSPVPYLATLLNCMLWMFYGVPAVHPHSILVVTINGVGFVLESLYILIFIAFSPKQMRLKVIGILAAEVLFMAVVITGVILGAHTHETRSLVVGVLCVIFCTCMYASPLSVVKLVIQTQSVRYMPFSVCLVGFLNSVCWTIYGFLPFDIFVIIPNVLGSLLGLAQLILYFRYYQSTPHDDNQPDVQQPAVDSADEPAVDSADEPAVDSADEPSTRNPLLTPSQQAATSADEPSTSNPLLTPSQQINTSSDACDSILSNPLFFFSFFLFFSLSFFYYTFYI